MLLLGDERLDALTCDVVIKERLAFIAAGLLKDLLQKEGGVQLGVHCRESRHRAGGASAARRGRKKQTGNILYICPVAGSHQYINIWVRARTTTVSGRCCSRKREKRKEAKEVEEQFFFFSLFFFFFFFLCDFVGFGVEKQQTDHPGHII